MNGGVLTQSGDVRRVAHAALTGAGALWFTAACIGQWIFASYVAVQYVGPALVGDVSGWNDIMKNGLVPGDAAGNVAMVAHLFIALVITVGGTLQLMPAVRRTAPTFHRWTGRVYVVIAIVAALGGLYMTWTREQVGGVSNDIAISLDAAMIVAFALLAIRAARARKFEAHQRWAMRTFLVVSGVWFMRVSFGFLILASQGRPPGSNATLTGPTDLAVSWGSFFLPILVYEAYLRAKRSEAVWAKWGIATLLLAASAFTVIGVIGATMIMWLPRIIA